MSTENKTAHFSSKELFRRATLALFILMVGGGAIRSSEFKSVLEKLSLDDFERRDDKTLLITLGTLSLGAAGIAAYFHEGSREENDE